MREIHTITYESPRDNWQTTAIDLREFLQGHLGQSLTLRLEAQTDVLFPTSFFVDDVKLMLRRP